MRFTFLVLLHGLWLVCVAGVGQAQGVPGASEVAPDAAAEAGVDEAAAETVSDAGGGEVEPGGGASTSTSTSTSTGTGTGTGTGTTASAGTGTTASAGTGTGEGAEPTLQLQLPPTEHPLLAIDDELFLGFLAIGGWGVARWKWFKSEFKFKKEHGFSQRSSTGGSDKTGHFFAGYIVSDLLAWRLRDMGYERTTAALWGATGSMALMTWIEIGDATSRYGWSFEDLLADFIGVAVSAALGIYPELDDLLDFRVQYWPSKGFLNGDNNDLVADYSGMKHLMAVKLSGIPYVRDTPLRYLEAQVGYYSRGFRSFDKVDPEDTRRVLYLGIGVTATEVLEPVLPRVPGVRAIAPGILTLLEYYQPPVLALEVAKKRW